MKLNLGSGYTHVPGFKRVDIDKKCEPDYLYDIRDLSQILSNSVEEIYTAHTIEHILLIELFPTIRGFCRILIPGGLITIIVPDSKTASEDWVNGKIKPDYFEKIMLGAQPNATPYMSHKQIFWPGKLARFLNIAGFTQIETDQNKNTYELTGTAIKPLEE
jgi:predicted SAM-dependent methyltransferase